MHSHRVTEAVLFKTLCDREQHDGFEAAEISSRVSLVVAEASPILQNVCRAFPLYTLHDPEHSFRVVENMAGLIPAETLNQLNSIELSLLLYTAYLHDIGMAANQEEIYKWVASDSYRDFLSSHEEWDLIIQAARNEEYESSPKGRSRRSKSGNAKSNRRNDHLLRIQDVMFTEFLRLSHAKRSAEFVMNRYSASGKSDNKININQVNYAEYVALICRSHWDDVRALRGEEYRRDRRIGRFPVNLQYCAIVLRLADLIDLDPERTPKVLLDFIMLDLKPGVSTGTNRVEKSLLKSAEEWAKHRAILGCMITPEEIRIEAKCSHPVVQRGLHEWCDYIDAERRECRLLVQENRGEITAKYKLPLDNEVRKSFIESDGSYIYSDFKFQLDYDRIVTMLMGTELWGNPLIAIRELLQNALDACAHRQSLSRRMKVHYTPRIHFSITWDRDKRHLSPHGFGSFILTCEDNGTGMDQHIVENYLMRIGRSYYNSPEFRQQMSDISPISQFGLGIMSCFMLTNAIRICTQRLNADMRKSEPLLVEVDSAERYVVMRPGEPQDGTRVSLFFTGDGMNSLFLHDPRANHFIHMMKGHHHKFDKMFFENHFRSDYPFMIINGLDNAIRSLALHLDIPIEISYQEDHVMRVESGPFTIPDIDRSELPCMKNRFQEFLFQYAHSDTGGLAGKFRFLLPFDGKGNPCLACKVEPVFKMFVDGDLLLTKLDHKRGPSMKAESKDGGDEERNEDEQWDTDEVRGVYRVSYGTRPPASKERYATGVDSGVFEAVHSHFRWSQDGLLVGELDEPRKEQSNEEVETHEHGISKDLFGLFSVPNLNAADIDMRGPWRVRLNVQRTRFLLDQDSVGGFQHRMYALAAEMWVRIVAQLLEKPCDRSAVKRLLRELYEKSNGPMKSALKERLPDPAESDQTFADRFVTEATRASGKRRSSERIARGRKPAKLKA